MQTKRKAWGTFNDRECKGLGGGHVTKISFFVLRARNDIDCL